MTIVEGVKGYLADMSVTDRINLREACLEFLSGTMTFEYQGQRFDVPVQMVYNRIP